MQMRDAEGMDEQRCGYHHHIGLNTWAGAGAPPPPRDAIGLRDFVIRLPNLDALNEVTERVRKAGIAIEETPTGMRVRDPSQNGIVLTAPKKENMTRRKT
jgi:catechol 2,3-dioxygenase